jgi:hypothetical protein
MPYPRTFAVIGYTCGRVLEASLAGSASLRSARRTSALPDFLSTAVHPASPREPSVDGESHPPRAHLLSRQTSSDQSLSSEPRVPPNPMLIECLRRVEQLAAGAA